MSARDAMRVALRQLMEDAGPLSQTELTRQLTEAAGRFELRSSTTNKAVSYDPGMVNRWLDGKLVPSRQAAWLLDMRYGRPMREPTFQDLRDRYVLENDRGQVPTAAAGDVPQMDNAHCPADSLAKRLPKRPLPIRADEVLSIGFFTVVDCELARKIIATLLERTSDVRAIAMYEVLGRWDLAVKVDFTDHRLVLTSTAGVQAPTGGAAQFLVLDEGEQYDRLRVQRSFLFVELSNVPELRRTVAISEIGKKASEFSASCGHVIEAITVSDDAVVLEIVLTCAQRRYLNQLNREMGRLLTWFEAQKTNLLVFTTDETGWLTAI